MKEKEELMSLLEIKKYLMQVKMASLSHLCTYFKCDSGVLRDMLCHWARKGCVRKFTKNPACGGQCNKCDVAVTEIYEWVFILPTH
jgi:putative ferrous iron transport protein C